MKGIALLITGILSGALAGCGAVPMATPFKIVDNTVLPTDVRTERPEADIPPSWDEALQLLETEGRSYRF